MTDHNNDPIVFKDNTSTPKYTDSGSLSNSVSGLKLANSISGSKYLPIKLSDGNFTRSSSAVNSSIVQRSADLRRSLHTSLESSTIHKQRLELQMLISELKDRDDELNSMVSSHQKQLLSWEEDRQRVLTLEQKAMHLKEDLDTKNEQIKSLKSKAKLASNEGSNHCKLLICARDELARVTDRYSKTCLHLRDLEEQNKSLNSSINELSTSLSQLEFREMELQKKLLKKDEDLSSASSHISALSGKLKNYDRHWRLLQEKEGDSRRACKDWKEKYTLTVLESDGLKAELKKSLCETQEKDSIVEKLNDEISSLKTQIEINVEREKRKDEMIELHKSKQERASAELSSLRQIHERQQRDLSFLHLNLECSKEILSKQHQNNNYVSPRRSYNKTDLSRISECTQLEPEKLDASFNNTVFSVSGSVFPASGSVFPEMGSAIPGIAELPAKSQIPHYRLCNDGMLNLSMDSECALPSSRDTMMSPACKLQRLLLESKQLVASLDIKDDPGQPLVDDANHLRMSSPHEFMSPPRCMSTPNNAHIQLPNMNNNTIISDFSGT